MAIFRNYNTFLQNAYFNLCGRESQVIFTVRINDLKDLNVNRTAVYSGDVMLPNHLVFSHCINFGERDGEKIYKHTLIFEGFPEKTELIRLKLVFLNGSFYDFNCYRNEADVYAISEG